MVTKLFVFVVGTITLNAFTFADEYRQIPQGGGRTGTVLIQTEQSPEAPAERIADEPPARRLKTVARWAGTHFIGIVFVPAD
jgi:hypothetical protein